MALKNAFGGLALDETIKQLIEKMRNWQDPQWVTSHPDIPVHVAGKVIPQPDPIISSRVFAAPTTFTAGLLVPANLNRSALSIYNAAGSTIMYVLASPLTNQTVSSTLHTVMLNVSDYWELAQGVNGCYKGPISAVWASNTGGFAMVTEYS